MNPRRQDPHALPILRLAFGFDQDKAPAPLHVDVGEFGGGRVQVELAGKIDLNDVGEAIGLRHIDHRDVGPQDTKIEHGAAVRILLADQEQHRSSWHRHAAQQQLGQAPGSVTLDRDDQAATLFIQLHRSRAWQPER